MMRYVGLPFRARFFAVMSVSLKYRATLGKQKNEAGHPGLNERHLRLYGLHGSLVRSDGAIL